MTLRYVLMIILCASCLWTSGCATVLTVAYPPVEETKQGGIKSGSPAGYHYAMTEDKDALLLQKQPLCTQDIQVINIKRKQLHGVIPAVMEIPFFGLGIADLVVAGSFAKASIEETEGGYVKGSEVVICGEMVFAPNEDLVIQFPESTRVSHVKTDGKGKISLEVLESMPKGEMQFNVFVREKDGYAYVKTFERNPR